MSIGSVRVTGPADRDVYVNGQYGEAAGKTGGTFLVEYGNNRFESLDFEYRVDYAANVTADEGHQDVEAELERIVPPLRTPLTPPDNPAGSGR